MMLAVRLLALATHEVPTTSGTMLMHEGAGAAMRDAHHAARKQEKQRLQVLAAALEVGEAPMQLESDRQPVGGQRYGNVLEPLPARRRRQREQELLEQNKRLRLENEQLRAAQAPHGGGGAGAGALLGDDGVGAAAPRNDGAPTDSTGGCDAAGAAAGGGSGGFADAAMRAMGVEAFNSEPADISIDELVGLLGQDIADAVVDDAAALGAGAAEATAAAVAAAWQPSGEAERALLAQMEAEEREAAAAAAAAGARDAMIEAINALPVGGAHERDASFKLRRSLETVARMWALYLDERPAMKARLAAADTVGPTWQDTFAWARWLLTTRCTQSAVDSALRGRTRDTVIVYLKNAMGHVWRGLYPQMEALSVGEWRGYWATVFGKFHALFTQEGRRKWGEAAAAAKRAQVSAAGGTAAAAAAAANEAKRAVTTMLAAATDHKHKRAHAELCDLYLVQDLLLGEKTAVNKALVVDAAIAIMEQIAHRPGMLTQDDADLEDEMSEWSWQAVLRMRDVLIDPFGVQGVVTEGGHAATLHLEINARRAKGMYMQKMSYKSSMTPNAVQMLRCGCVRLLRLVARRGFFRATFAKLAVPMRRALMRRIQAPHWCGLNGYNVTELTGYKSCEALVEAAKEDQWVVGLEGAEGSAERKWDEWMLEQPWLPAVDPVTDAFVPSTSFMVDDLCTEIVALGVRLGFEEARFGAWSLRKLACQLQAKTGDTYWAARYLGHRHVNSQTMDRVYVQDLRWRDSGAAATGRDWGAFLSLSSLAATRVPEVAVVTFSTVPKDAKEYVDVFENDAGVVRATAALKRAVVQVALRLGRTAAQATAVTTFAGLRIGKQQRATLVATEGGAELLAELEVRRHEAATAKLRAREPTLKAYRRRLWADGQTHLRLHPEVRAARVTPQELPVLSEACAIAFGMGRVGGREPRD